MAAEETDVFQLSSDFHAFYRSFHMKRSETARLSQKKDKSVPQRNRQKLKLLSDSITTTLPITSSKIEILGNCSIFAVYASVRQIVLEFNFADACRKWLIPLEENEAENDNALERIPSPISLPKIIGIGLEGVFQLIQESYEIHPKLAVKALDSLLNIMEGQHPQSLKKEPIPAVDAMFTMLLTLSKYEEPENVAGPSKTILSSELTPTATSCLISLAIARGDTKSMLEAIASLFMCPESLATQQMRSPEVLKSLQKSIAAILVGRASLPQWLTHGIPMDSVVDFFHLSFPKDPAGCVFSAKALVSDGKFLYLHCSRGLYKVGSGYFGTIRGQIYASQMEFHSASKVFFGCASGQIYYRVLNPTDTRLHLLNTETLETTESLAFEEDTSITMFSDGTHLGYVKPSKEDGFLVRTLKSEKGGFETLNEFNIRLVRKSVEVCGPCPWDVETSLRPILTGVDDDVTTITAGKDFALLRTQHGRIMYCGKGASLGQKSGISKCSKWLELGLSKCPRFVECAVGHEGIHALFLGEDGTAYFVGTPKRGEDGDQGKARRVAKASKPKKVIRMEGHDVIHVACNNGTSAFVTRTGEAYLFGKDTAHCDPASGYLVGLRGVFITQIAMGKAHALILSGDGKVYTMGINNRGQCGRSLSQSKEDAVEEDEGEWEEILVTGGASGNCEQEGICPPGSHRWKHEQCMVCTICRECTGYGSACISALRPDRNPGQECGCGVGDAGCAECGSCRTCAREGIEDQEFLAMEPQRIPEPPLGEMNLEEGDHGDRFVGNEESFERRPSKSSTKCLKQKVELCGKENSMTSFPPSRLHIVGASSIIQVASGLHHSMFLDAKGNLFVCGSNTFGQLGMGDFAPRHLPVKVKFPEGNPKIIQIAAGSYHSLALDSNGIVYTCGAYSKGQLAREGDENDVETMWFARMAPLDNVGTHHGRRVTWIGATGDSTFVRLEASLISPKLLRKATVTANGSTIMIIPPPNYGKLVTAIMINRRDGYCSYFEGENQMALTTSAVTFDPFYAFLWTYEWRKHVMSCYNVVASSVKTPQLPSNMWILRPPFAIPSAKGSNIQRWHAAANMLASMDTLVACHVQGLSVHQEEQTIAPCLSRMYGRDDYSAVCRFESHGGGWGYSGHSIEAIRFSCDADILLGGYGLFGGRGEYCAKIKIYDIGHEGGEVEGDGELLAETEEIPFDCNPRQKYRMMFEDPVPLQSGRWYVAWAHISGPSSDCGSSGQSSVITEDQIMFHFKSSKKSNNGTDVNAGQLAQILYRLMSSDLSSLGTKPKCQLEPIHLLTNDFVTNFAPGSFNVLMSLVRWSWEEIETLAGSPDNTQIIFKIELMKFISCSSLRLIEFSINQVYPYKGCGRLGQMENLSLAESIGDARTLLQTLISSQINSSNPLVLPVVEEIMKQCCSTFVNCFQVFYPTSSLKWECLAHFLHLHLESGKEYWRMLSSVIGSLCECRGQLLGIFPVLNTIVRQSPDETSLTFVTNTEGGKLKQPANNRLLVSQMAARNDLEDFFKPSWTFWEVLNHLLAIVNLDGGELEDPSRALVFNSSILLAKLVEELVSHASGIYSELESLIGQIIVATPSRFTRTNQSRTWNTGNGSPDAVCFTVDQPGVSVFGACIYSGTGSYEYELEIFQEVDQLEEVDSDQSGGVQWTSLEVSRGTFDSDDCYGDIAEIKFPRPLHIKPGVKYAIRLKNQGGRTSNGDGGVSILRCPDGTTFTFSSSALSFNGTNQIRGQIPHILYFRNPDDSEARQKTKAVAEMQARKCAHRICAAVLEAAKDVLESGRDVDEMCRSSLVTTLLPSILSHLPQLAMSHPRSSVELLELIRKTLPSVADLNNQLLAEGKGEKDGSGVHYSWVESPHPYKPATIAHYKVAFSRTVQRMTVEFDPRCSTAQSEDTVRMYIPLPPDGSPPVPDEPLASFIPIMDKFSGPDNWPLKAIVLPGNEVLFSLETASDYARAEKNHYFGFRALVTGYEWKEMSGMARLEMELSFLAGFSAHELIKKTLVLPPVSAEEIQTSVDVPEEKMVEICMRHHGLFAKGIGLEYFPAVQEALDGIVPLREKSKEREFIADFIARTPSSGGERLANYLQPQSFVDPHKSEVIVSKEAMKRGKLAVFLIITRDQHGDPVVAVNLQVEMKAVPLMASEPRRSHSFLSRGRNIPQVAYQVVVKEKMRYNAITIMKEYEDVSFEELRFSSPSSPRSSESMLVRAKGNATFMATWTPACAGLYFISLAIDGYEIPEACRVEVEESPEGPFPTVRKLEEEPFEPLATLNMRKFKAKDSAGLRVRSHPSLQSEQIGCLPINGLINFIQEVHNDDGIWVKLDPPSLNSFSQPGITKNFRLEGWCLQYNQHLGKTFLFPVEPPKSLPGNSHNPINTLRKSNDIYANNMDNSSKVIRLNEGQGLYRVVKCGVSGHNIRTRPCLRSPPVGILVLGSKFFAVDECFNNEGQWVKLDSNSQRKYCFTSDGEAWSLAVGRGQVTYLRQSENGKTKKGFDFSVAAQNPQSIFQNVSPPAAFGSLDLGNLSSSEGKSSFEDLPSGRHVVPEEQMGSDDSAKNSIEVEKAGEEPPPTPKRRPKSSSTFGALQKWLQIGSESRHSFSTSTASKCGLKDMSKSLVKDRISALTKPTTICIGTQTSPKEETPFQFTIGSCSSPTHDASPVKKSPKSERKHKGCPRSRGGRREKTPLKIPPIPPVSNEVLNAPVKEAIGPGEAQSIRAVFGAVLWHAGIIHDAMAAATFLRFNPQTSEEESKVVMRKKQSSPGKPQRHSVEVTTAAWYLKENPGASLKPFDPKPEVKQEEIGGMGEQIPPVITALEKIWSHVKTSLKKEEKSSIDPGKVKYRKERRRLPDDKGRTRKERPKGLQTTGRSFLLEPEEQIEFLEETHQCEMCQVRFSTKGKSRKAHFGLSSLCENCSERGLRLKKNCHSKPSESSRKDEGESTVLNNALFLLQMINTEGKEGNSNPPVLPVQDSFRCYEALEVSPILKPEEIPFEIQKPTERVEKLATDDLEFSPNRRRKGSNGDQLLNSEGDTLMKNPSPPLLKILEVGEIEAIGEMCSGVLAFVKEKHELESLRLFLFQAIRRVICRAYGMEILAWLIRNVSQTVSLHDLLWWFACSLDCKAEDESPMEKESLDEGWWELRTLPHTESPASIFPILSESFYTLLQTISDIMPHLPIGAPLLEMAVKCWGVSFNINDHRFLHKSQIFRNLSKIMSQFDRENGEWTKVPCEDSHMLTTTLSDLTKTVDIRVSSRAALSQSLIDDSTETFWESGDEDRNRTKGITVLAVGDISLKVIALHIDNGRDAQYKVGSIVIKVGAHPDDMHKIGQLELDSRFYGWNWLPITCEETKVVKMELKGPDNTLRVRQIKVLGSPLNEDKGGETTGLIAHTKCENETLRIFRLLSSEVFGKLLNSPNMMREEENEMNDLQEHVVGILFSRNRLTYLQKQVCSHIVSAIHRESVKIKEEFHSHSTTSLLEATGENVRLLAGDKPKIGDRYCFEMLSLVLALVGSQVGRSYISQQNNLIQDLMQLLHAGTPRIQRQVTLVVRKILPEIHPGDLAKILSCSEFEEGRVGVVDILLGCIVKALQVKVRKAADGTRSAKNININDIFTRDELPPFYWFLRGEADIQLANTVVKLIKDMSEESFSFEWSIVTKPAIAEAVLFMTKMKTEERNCFECLNSPKFWLALAALCVLHEDHSRLLSSPNFLNGTSRRAKCENHDDGETLAVIQCKECRDLCTECDRILHLPKKNWNHSRKVCKEEEESIRVDLHEGCGRIKLFWLMALADSSTLKALIEFRNGIPKGFSVEATSSVPVPGQCRFCNKTGNSGTLALGNVCSEVECQEYGKTACERILPCGHLCGGVRNEVKCLPCLQGCSDKLESMLKQDSDDMCMICFTDALAFAPAIQLLCGHVFHYHCCRSVLEKRWAGPRITFSFSYCPICKVEISHNLLDFVLSPIRELFEDVQRKALMRLEYEGLNKAEGILHPGSRFYKDPAAFAMDRYAYYVCSKCNKAYFGGEARCDIEIQCEFNPSELVCGGCSDVSQAQLCPKHGTDYLEYKCRYCCSVAVFFCFGTTHFCNGCHDDFQRITAIPKAQLPSCPAGPRARQGEGEECPLHVTHPPTGEEFALGCGICRNAHTF